MAQYSAAEGAQTNGAISTQDDSALADPAYEAPDDADDGTDAWDDSGEESFEAEARPQTADVGSAPRDGEDVRTDTPKSEPVDLVQALATPDSSTFFRHLIGHFNPALALAIDREGDRATAPSPSTSDDLIAHRLRRYLVNGFSEPEALEDLISRLPNTRQAEAAIPVLAALLARRVLHSAPHADSDQSSARYLLVGAVRATRKLLARHRLSGLRVMPALARHAARRAETEPVDSIAAALPALALRIARAAEDRATTTSTSEPPADVQASFSGTRRWTSGHPRRFVLHGPVEITILQR